MSSRPGEQAIADGMLYQSIWAVQYLVRLLEDRGVASVQIGGAVSEAGVDFRVKRAGRIEHHQVKRARGTHAHWTLSALEREHVLSRFNAWLAADSTSRCFFESTVPCVELSHLSDHARRANDFNEFIADYARGKHKEWFKNLCRIWSVPEQEAWERLKRVVVETNTESSLVESVQGILPYLIIEPPDLGLAQLVTYCLENVNRLTTKQSLWAWLREKGITPRPQAGDKSLRASMARQTERYLAGVRAKFIVDPPLHRPVSDSMMAQLQSSPNGADLVLLGEPGGGKSAIMHQLATLATNAHWPIIAFRLDDLPDHLPPDGLQSELSLPVPPAHALRLAAEGSPAVLLIDQLDAVSEYSGRTGTLIDRVAELITEVRQLRSMAAIHVVLACREVDWKHHGQLRKLHSKEDAKNETDGIFRAAEWSDEDIDHVLRQRQIKLSAFTPSQRKTLLSRPQYLAVVVDLCPADDEIPPLATPKALFDAYWIKKSREVTTRPSPIQGNLWEDVLRTMSQHLSNPAKNQTDTGPLFVPRRLLSKFDPCLDRMITNGVISVEGHRCRFAHETFYDYCFGRFFEERDISLHDHLLTGDQPLECRGQVRQVLAHLRDEPQSRYLETVRELLQSNDIRTHVKILVIAGLCAVDAPSQQEWEVLRPWIEETLHKLDAPAWHTMRGSAYSNYFQSPGMFKLSLSSGWIAKQLQDSSPEATSKLFRFIFRHHGSAQAEVWELIKPLVNDPRFASDLEFLAESSDVAGSREMFEWVVAQMRRVIKEKEKRHQWHGFFRITDGLAKHRPEWVGEWIAAVIDARLEHKLIRSDLVQDYMIGKNAMPLVVAAAPSQLLDHVIPSIMHAAVADVTNRSGTWSRCGVIRQEHDSHLDADDHLFDGLVDALRQLASQGEAAADKWLDMLKASTLEPASRLYADVLCGDVPALADRAAEFLLSGDDALQSVNRFHRLAPEIILKHHVPRMSLSQLQAVEEKLLAYLPDWQFEFPLRRDENGVPRCAGNHCGLNQMTFLRAIPEERRSPRVRRRLAEWERKFASSPLTKPPSRVVKAIPDAALSHMSPTEFEHGIATAHHRRNKSRPSDDEYEDDGSTYHCVAFDALVKAARERPVEFLDYLQARGTDIHAGFRHAFDQALESTDYLTPEQAWLAIQALRNQNAGHHYRILRLFDRLDPHSLPGEALDLLFDYASDRPLSEHPSRRDDDKDRVGQLERAALDSERGRAIIALQSLIWAEWSVVDRLRSRLPMLMQEPDTPTRALLASVCHAVARHDAEEDFAMELFQTLSTHAHTGDLAPASHWFTRFIWSGLSRYFGKFRPHIERMIASAEEEVRRAGARLMAIAALTIAEARDAVTALVLSDDSAVRSGCAVVAGYNLDYPQASSWCQGTLLTLANDASAEVRQSVGQSFRREKPYDFSSLEDWLLLFVSTPAFFEHSNGLLDAIVESHGRLPSKVVGFVRTAIDRCDEPWNDSSSTLGLHIHSLGSITKRLYVENRDTPLRAGILELIDLLSARGGIDEHDIN
jgi:hypothetical protein